jgi:hypothetical protein
VPVDCVVVVVVVLEAAAGAFPICRLCTVVVAVVCAAGALATCCRASGCFARCAGARFTTRYVFTLRAGTVIVGSDRVVRVTVVDVVVVAAPFVVLTATAVAAQAGPAQASARDTAESRVAVFMWFPSRGHCLDNV